MAKRNRAKRNKTIFELRIWEEGNRIAFAFYVRRPHPRDKAQRVITAGLVILLALLLWPPLGKALGRFFFGLP